jgi:GalNAc-alpha-(1->4)-GalNAc-alpha-(1->3)-diNAcBac-PP-undecaprenol alpha-1,4-N-acetyl-D-galactosaminyltransferase
MKIAIFSRTFDGVPGGVEKMVLTLASELKKLNHTVLVISLDSPDAQAFYEWPVGVIWEKVSLGNPDLKASFCTRTKRVMSIRRILKHNQIESVVGFQIGAFALIRLASFGLGIHTVAAERNAPTLFGFIHNGKMIKLLANTLLLSSSCITVQMPSYIKMYPKFLRHKIHCTPNPIFPVTHVKSKSNEINELIKILYVGRLTYQKNLKTLILAIKESGVDVELTIVGNGPDRQQLQQIAKENCVQVNFHNATSELSSYYSSADLFCIPSRWEGFPNVVGEALAHGLPVIAFKGCSGMSDLIESGKNGILAEGNDDFLSLAIAIQIASNKLWDPTDSIKSCETYSIRNFTKQWALAISPKK